MKYYRVPILVAILLTLAGTIFWFARTSRAATETPDYKVIRTDGKFEIREYSDLIVASTPMEGEEMNRSFGQLFRYITGSNEASQKIEMTTPVLIDTAQERKTMSFIMPKKTVEKGVPKPAGETVRVRSVAAARYAVWRFSGGRTAENEKGAIEELRAQLATRKLEAKGEPIFAYYDPPWTPTPLRRNEVFIAVDPSEK